MHIFITGIVYPHRFHRTKDFWFFRHPKEYLSSGHGVYQPDRGSVNLLFLLLHQLVPLSHPRQVSSKTWQWARSCLMVRLLTHDFAVVSKIFLSFSFTIRIDDRVGTAEETGSRIVAGLWFRYGLWAEVAKGKSVSVDELKD